MTRAGQGQGQRSDLTFLRLVFADAGVGRREKDGSREVEKVEKVEVEGAESARSRR